MIGSQDLLIALAIGLVMFGAKKLPELARGLGESVKEFKKGIANEPDPVPSTEPRPPAALASPAAPARHCANCQASLASGLDSLPEMRGSVYEYRLAAETPASLRPATLGPSSQGTSGMGI